jgi:predicted ATPase
LVQDPVQRDPVGLGGGRLPDAVDELLRAGEAGVHPIFDVSRDVMSMVDWVDDIETVPTPEAPLSRAVPNVGRSALLFHDRYMRQALTAADASEGALYVLFAAVMAAHPRSPYSFAIDNFDHGLNPRLAKRLTQCFTGWCLHYNRQAFLTAHSPQVLDGLPLNDHRVRLFTLDRTSRGRTSVNPVDVSRVLEEKAKNGGASLSQLWLSGVLGGMPGV